MPWTDGVDGRRPPAQISPFNFVRNPAVHLAAAKETDHQLDLFVVRDDGAIWFSSVVDYGLWDVWTRITPTNLFPLIAPIVAIRVNNDQLNVYAVSRDGAVLRTWRAQGGPLGERAGCHHAAEFCDFRRVSDGGETQRSESRCVLCSRGRLDLDGSGWDWRSWRTESGFHPESCTWRR